MLAQVAHDGGVALFALAEVCLQLLQLGIGGGDAAVDGGEVVVEAVDHLLTLCDLLRELPEAFG